MQNIIIGYVERLHDRMSADGHLSIATASAAQLASLQKPALLRLRDAALDLARIVELELGSSRFDEPEAAQTWQAIQRGDLHSVAGLTIKRGRS